MFGIEIAPLTIVIAVVVGALLLSAGLFLSVWLAGTRNSKTSQEQADLLGLMDQLSRLTATFSGDFSDHQKLLADVSNEFDKMGHSSEASVEFKHILDRMNAANSQLNSRLKVVQAELDAKASQVDDLISESRTDALTLLANRRSFNEQMTRRISEITRYQGELSFVIIDVDHFKLFNDTYGHLVGDEVLQTVAKVIGSTARDSDFPARLGGEEFGIIMPSTGLKEACLGADRVRTAIQKTALKIGGKTVSITASLGVTEILSGDTPAQVVDRADRALYAAKNAGRNRVWFSQDSQLKPMSGSEDKSPAVPGKMKDVCQSLRDRLIESIDS